MDNNGSGVIEPHVLIALDGSRSSYQAVDYTVHLTGLIPHLNFILLYVLPQTPPIFKSEARTDGRMRSRLKKLEAANREKAQQILDQAKRHLTEHNIAPERIETRIRRRHSGLAKDIINEAEMGNFDALVIGRRGLTRTQELFMGSVSNQLIQHAANVPLWIIDGQVTQPKILAAVDGSEASLRAVDHMGFMLGKNGEAQVDFLHITPKLQNFCSINFDDQDQHWDDAEGSLDELEADFVREDEACMDDFLRKAVDNLAKAGFSRNRISVDQREVALGVARTIIKTAKEGDYGTIVLGRRGMGRSSFLGSISDKVIRGASNKAVWVVN
jgi:nucleotide-binding universal stress UspA family protein